MKYYLYSKYFCQAYLDVAWNHGVQSPERKFMLKSSIFWNYTLQIGFYSIFSLHPACKVNTLFKLLNLLGSGLRTNIQSPTMPRPTKNSAHVVNTGVFQDNSIVLQESSSSCINGGPKPTVYSTIYRSVTTICATHVYAIYWRAKDGLDYEW